MGEISITTLGLIIGLGVVGMCGILICMACRNKKDWKTIDLRAPLIQDAPSRVDEALAVAQHGSSKCTACGFDNFSHVALCVVCGDAVGDDATRKKTIKRRKKISPPETYAVRAERAKRRGEWVRKTDVQGKIYWFRGPVSDPTHQPIEAAHTVHFDGANNYVPGKTLDAVPGLSVRWVDPTTADADAAAFPVGATLLGATTPLLALADQPFPTRYAEFVQRASALASPSGRVRLRIRDATKPAVFQQAVRQLLALSPEDLRGQILIRLDNGSALAGSTEAVDWHRDWLASLSDTLADPATGLFTCVNRVDQTYFLNADSRAVLGDDHLDYFFAVGRLLGHVLVQGDLLGFHLAPPLLKILLGRPLGFHDLEHFDPETYRSLRSLLSATATDVDALALDFSVHERRGDTLETIDLVPNGRNVRVTDATKHDFLTRKTQRVLVESVADQLAALCRGFYDVVPHELLMLLQDAEELDYVLCGADEIDVDEWERESKYNQYLFDHPALKFFWRVVRGLPEDYKRRLLHYATGSTRVPLGGFAALKSFDGRLAPFSLHSAELVDTELVRSQPCLNKLTLPLYVSEKKLRTHLLAILDPEIYEFAIAKQ